MKRLIALLALLPLLAMGGGQTIMTGNHRHVFAASGVVLPVYANNCNSEGGNPSCSLTVSSGDLVYMFCGVAVGSGVTGLTPSSSPSASWTAQTLLNSSTSWGRGAWAIMSTSGSTTFTCTVTPVQSYPLIQVYQYTGGTGASVITSASATSNTAGPFTTTGPSLTVVCGVGGGGTWTVGTVGGNTATHFVTPAFYYSSCQDYSTSSPMSSAYSIINPTGSPIVNVLQSTSFQ